MLLRFERQAWTKGHRRVAGVDEAGRGPLAGPVVAAAVVFDPDFIEHHASRLFDGLTDSKRLSESRRDFFFGLLLECAQAGIGVGQADVNEIDARNILRATHLAMARALAQLDPAPDHALVDGRPVPDLPCSSTAIVGGDGRSLSIAAASVVAKVTRDRIMVELDRQYPNYGFARHKGYGTPEHLRALRKYGPTPVHRRSFEPVYQPSLDL
ncbi:MAG: ribonuclease HII [Verrucomicrobiota bacterium]